MKAKPTDAKIVGAWLRHTQGISAKLTKDRKRQIDDLKALRRAVRRKDKVTVVRTIKPASRGR